VPLTSFFPLAPIVLLGACLGGRARLDEWTPLDARQTVDVWSHGRRLRLHGATVLLDSITGIPYDMPLTCDSCRVGLPRAQIDSAFVIRGSPLLLAMKSDRYPSPPDRPRDENPHLGGLAGTFGVASGSGTIACSACAHAGSMSGTSFTIQLVKRVSPQLRAGWTTNAWWHSGDDWGLGIWDLSAVLLYHPSTERGFFIGGGPSYAMMVATVTDSTGLQRHGWGFTSAMGYELRLRSATSLTPFVQYARAWVGDIYYPKDSGIPWARGWKHQVLSVGLGVTFHNRRKERSE
jgi:hypothetical protein